MMWARVAEVALACWLAMSPFIFRHPADDALLWANDLGGAIVVMTLALLSFWKPARNAHLLLIPVGLWLVGFGYFRHGAPSQAEINRRVAHEVETYSTGEEFTPPSKRDVRQPVPPAMQNEILVGLFLLMFAVLPNHASRPPESWEAWIAEHGDRDSQRSPDFQSGRAVRDLH